MFTKHLFRFGYMTPGQFARNQEHGWDDEDSTAVWIISASRDEAMRWGRIVAVEFVSSLFGATPAAYSWSRDGFAHWIDDDPETLAASSYLPVIQVGEMPAFELMRGNR